MFYCPNFFFLVGSLLIHVFAFQMSNKRPLEVFFVDNDEDEDKFYNLKVLLPNSTSVTLTLTNPQPEMLMKNFVNLVKEEYEKTRKNCDLSGKKRKKVDWNLAAKSYLDFNGEKIKGMVRFAAFKPDLCNIIRLDVSWFLSLLLLSFCSVLMLLVKLIMIFLMFLASTLISGSGWVW